MRSGAHSGWRIRQKWCLYRFVPSDDVPPQPGRPGLAPSGNPSEEGSRACDDPPGQVMTRSKRMWIIGGIAAAALLVAGGAWSLTGSSPRAAATPAPSPALTKAVLGPNGLIMKLPNLCAVIRPPMPAGETSVDDTSGFDPDPGIQRYQLCLERSEDSRTQRELTVNTSIYPGTDKAQSNYVFNLHTAQLSGSSLGLGDAAFCVLYSTGPYETHPGQRNNLNYTPKGATVTARFRNIVIHVDWSGADFSTSPQGKQTASGLPMRRAGRWSSPSPERSLPASPEGQCRGMTKTPVASMVWWPSGSAMWPSTKVFRPSTRTVLASATSGALCGVGRR